MVLMSIDITSQYKFICSRHIANYNSVYDNEFSVQDIRNLGKIKQHFYDPILTKTFIT